MARAFGLRWGTISSSGYRGAATRGKTRGRLYSVGNACGSDDCGAVCSSLLFICCVVRNLRHDSQAVARELPGIPRGGLYLLEGDASERWSLARQRRRGTCPGMHTSRSLLEELSNGFLG
ncbi:hypothetical protein LR48_Vigan08g103700 [Vigna angularis]|uniref:Uncharacterized protein n=1 Tax=Phaseolus angularis TaxID=3914 RepID=A0A0L9V540_PHAAN|nr:hypothetical protein LR48_Vigan08g103700 [Vigna angularis]